MGHVKMMGAVQPFISGAISKTVNLPEQTSVDEVAQLLIEAWQLGVKAIAIYRDNCKVAQPLSGSKDSSEEGRIAQIHALGGVVAGTLGCPGELPDHRPLDDAVLDGLRQWVVDHRLRKDAPLVIARRGAEVELRDDAFVDGLPAQHAPQHEEHHEHEQRERTVAQPERHRAVPRKRAGPEDGRADSRSHGKPGGQ